MPDCKACGTSQAQVYPVQEVLTQHIRGLKESRVQALGERLEVALCDACLDAFVHSLVHPQQALTKAGLGFGAMLVLAVVMFFFFGAGSVPDLRLAGILLAGFAVLGFRQRYLALRAQQAQAREGSPQAQRERFLDTYLLRVLPTKSGENSQTYIPLTKEVVGMTAAQLMNRFRLLPQIALQLHERLHKQE